MVRAAGCSASKIGSQVLYSSGALQPRRVLTETGKEVDFFAFLKHSTAKSGVLIIAAPPPALLTCLSGQPKLRSTPEKPRLLSAWQVSEKCSGFLPQIWAMMGLSVGATSNLSKALWRPFSEA